MAELTVDVELGLTMEINGSWIKPTAAVRGIKIDGDVEQQLTSSLDAIGLAWVKIDEKLEELVLGEIAQNPSNPTSDVISKMKKQLGTMQANLNSTIEEVKRHKTQYIDTIKYLAPDLVPDGSSDAEGSKEASVGQRPRPVGSK